MIQIERLRMHLPRGFEHRATSIARMVGEALARRHLSQDWALDSLSLKCRHISLGSSDGEVAGLIVEEIVAAVEGRSV
jgi:hypothetical protein